MNPVLPERRIPFLDPRTGLVSRPWYDFFRRDHQVAGGVTGISPAISGGTGHGEYAVGDLLQANSTATLARLAAVAAGSVLLSGGVGTVSAWGKVALSGSTTHITGTLPTGSGGTGLTAFAQGDLLYASAINTLAALAKSSSSTRYLANTGLLNAPQWDQVNLTNGVTGRLPLTNVGGVGTAGKILRSDGTDYAATTATYPDTLAANQIPYATSANVIGGSNALVFTGTRLHITANTPTIRIENTAAGGQTMEFFAGITGVGIGTPTTSSQLLLQSTAPSGAINVGVNSGSRIQFGVTEGLISASNTNLLLKSDSSGTVGRSVILQGFAGSWQDAITLPNKSSGTIDVKLAASGGNVIVGGTGTPIARLQLPAGSTSLAPLLFISGTSLTSPLAGTVEMTTDDLFFTITTGPARKRLLMADPVGGLTSGRLPFVTTNGRLTDSANATLDSSGNLGTATHTFADAGNIVVGTSTGTKIGTATSQKLGLWNATPIVQPTTAVAAATFAANTSGIVDDSATFDGYTIGQVVKALRNFGALA